MEFIEVKIGGNYMPKNMDTMQEIGKLSVALASFVKSPTNNKQLIDSALDEYLKYSKLWANHDLGISEVSMRVEPMFRKNCIADYESIDSTNLNQD